METPGEFLRKKREERGRSLEEVAGVTNIRAEVLRNLEADLFGFAPAPVYVVGALTAYARALGVDPAEVLDRYREMTKPPEPQAAKEPERRKTSFRLGWKVPRAAVPAIAAAAAVILIGAMFWARRSFESREQGPVGAEVWTEIPAAPEAIPETAPEPVPQHAPQAGLRTEPQDQPRHAPGSRGRVVLEMTVRESTWVGLEMDRAGRYSDLLGPGARKRWEADSLFFIKIGNAGGVDLMLDGEPVSLPRERGRVVVLDLPPREGRVAPHLEFTRPSVADSSGGAAPAER